MTEIDMQIKESINFFDNMRKEVFDFYDEILIFKFFKYNEGESQYKGGMIEIKPLGISRSWKTWGQNQKVVINQINKIIEEKIGKQNFILSNSLLYDWTENEYKKLKNLYKVM